MTFTLLAALLISLILSMGAFAALEMVLGRTLAAVLCPMGWLGVLAAEGAIDAARGE